jgi:Mn-dependent DtxR family transcriptional regulator
MDESDPLEARTQRLHDLRTTDPVAWAICNGKTGVGTISDFLNWSTTHVQAELNRLHKAKEVTRKKYYRGYAYRPASLELKRLARRAWKLRQEK